MAMRRWLVAVLAMALFSGCSKKQEAMPLPMTGESAKAGARLAYEHTVDIELPQAQIAQRMQGVREACESQRFGACNVLRIQQGNMDGVLVVRVVPGGVEPMVAMAGQGGRLSSRETHAEDLADAVQNNQQNQAQLDAYAKRLDELSSRKDLAVADLITLSHEQATVQQQRDALLGEAAMQQRRLDTNRLELHFRNTQSGERGHRLGQSFDRLLDQLTDGIDDAISMLAYGLPFLLLAFPLVLLWRWAWRRITRRARPDA